MTNYVNYNQLKKERSFREQNGKIDAVGYFVAIASILSITSSVYYFIG